MKINPKTKKAGIFAGSLFVIMIAVFSVFATGIFEPSSAEPQLPEEHLFVEEIYLLKTEETNETVSVTCTPYLTNIWDEESGDIKIIAYVVKKSNNIADCKNTVEIGKISADSTAELEVPIVLSGDTYKVDMLIFEDGKLVLKGSLTIKAVVQLETFYEYDDCGVEIGKEESASWKLTCEGDASDFYRVSHSIVVSTDI
jgi:hypothetical protein